MNFLRRKAIKIIYEHVLERYEEIQVESGKCRYNFCCHKNAVHEALLAGESHVVLVLMVKNKHPIIHFINRNKEGVFTDNTLGRWSETLNYYYVGDVHEDYFFNIDKVFREFSNDLYDVLPTWLDLLLLDKIF